ncbi:hypothetical protein KJ682_18605 [bacterium]|nr:hypothetical protein [bacterium]
MTQEGAGPHIEDRLHRWRDDRRAELRGEVGARSDLDLAVDGQWSGN